MCLATMLKYSTTATAIGGDPGGGFGGPDPQDLTKGGPVMVGPQDFESKTYKTVL